MCVTDIKMARSVDFFILTRKLMLLDCVVKILIHGNGGHKACLHAAFHDLTVDVKLRFLILFQHAFIHHAVQALAPFFVDFVRVVIDTVRQVNFSAHNTEETIRIALGHFARFFAVHHIIGKACDLGD